MVGEVHIHGKTIFEEPHKRASIDGGAGSQKLVDLSHTIEHGLVTYKGLPAPIICDYLSREASRKQYAAGTEFQIGKIEMVANTGTYIDCPFHRYEHGKDLSEVGVERLAELDGIVIRADHKKTYIIDADFFRGKELRGRAVLVHSGWDGYWNTEQYFEHHPHLTEDAARYLVACGVKLVGIDSVNIDDTRGGERPGPARPARRRHLSAKNGSAMPGGLPGGAAPRGRSATARAGARRPSRRFPVMSLVTEPFLC